MKITLQQARQISLKNLQKLQQAWEEYWYEERTGHKCRPRTMDGIVPARKSKFQNSPLNSTSAPRVLPSLFTHQTSSPHLTGQPSSEYAPSSNTVAPERQETTIGESAQVELTPLPKLAYTQSLIYLRSTKQTGSTLQ